MGNDQTHSQELEKINSLKNIEDSRWFVSDVYDLDIKNIPIHPLDLHMSYQIEVEIKNQNAPFITLENGTRIVKDANDKNRNKLIQSDMTPINLIKININNLKVKNQYNIVSNRLSNDLQMEKIDNVNFVKAFTAKMCICPYNKIIEGIKINNDDKFLIKFFSFSLFMEVSFKNFLLTTYNEYLKNILAVYKAKELLINFEVLIHILTNNLIDLHNESIYIYIKLYLLNNVNKNNLCENIVKMYNECGALFKKIQNFLKKKDNKKDKEVILYYLLLMFALNECKVTKSQKMYLIQSSKSKNNEYEPNNYYYLNNQILLTKKLPINYVKSKSTLIEIEYDSNPINVIKYPYLCSDAYNIYKISNFYNEDEVILSENSILQCIKKDQNYLKFKIVRDAISNYADSLDYNLKRVFYIGDDVLRINVKGYSEPVEYFMNVKYLKFHNKCLQYANKFRINLNALEGMECFNLYTEKGDLVKILSIMDGKEKGECNLKYLDLKGNEIQESGILNLNKYFQFIGSKLQYLNLGYNLINDKSIKELKFSELKNLKFLLINDNNISYIGIKYLVNNFIYLTELTCLNIKNNVQIGQFGVEEIANKLDKLPNLNKIDFSHIGINNAGVSKLINSIIDLNNKYIYSKKNSNKSLNEENSNIYTGLKWINLKSNLFGGEMIKFQIFNLINNLQEIEYLNVNCNNFDEIDLYEINNALTSKNKITIGSANKDLINYKINQLKVFKMENSLTLSNESDSNRYLITISSINEFNNFFKDPKKPKRNRNCNSTLSICTDLEFTPDIEIPQAQIENYIKKFPSICKCLNNLSYLSLDSCTQIPDSLLNKILYSLSNIVNLNSLNLNNLNLSNKIDIFKSNMGQLYRIEKLSLCFNDIDEYFFVETSEYFFFFTNLKYLDLYGNLINDECMKIFCLSLKDIKDSKLEYINFGRNLISSSGYEHINKMIPILKDLNYVNFSYNLVDDTAVEFIIRYIKYIVNLDYYDIRNNCFTKSGISQLQQKGISSKCII